jgi:aerobic carbon-monoxide dehydrogenase small subunit
VPQELTLTLNGTSRHFHVPPTQLLVELIRETAGLTGTHVGCDTSQCGSCTVLVDGRATKSCTVLAVQCEGTDIVTVEGLAKNGELHPIQRAFSGEHALQCGFCTPGLMITAVDFLTRNPKPTDQEIRRAIDGNLCRCTGYHNIVNAIRTAGAEMAGTRKATSTKAPAEVTR